MTRRRRASIAIVALAGVLVSVGLGAQRNSNVYTSRDLKEDCKTDLAHFFEFAADQCAGIEEEYAGACEAAHVLSLCPDEVTCTELDPVWCAPCTDTHGAPFWDNLDGAITRCSGGKQGWDFAKMDTHELAVCVDADIHRHCPELGGSSWFAWHQKIRGGRMWPGIQLPPDSSAEGTDLKPPAPPSPSGWR
jgi:hypothetical protein